MAVKIVTDSTCDIPAGLARELGMTVVPLTVHFGQESFRDGVDIGPDEFFHKLRHSQALPTTSQPPAGDFARVYHDLSSQTREILSLHISAKLSGTYNSAVLGKETANQACHIEVVDTLQASIGLGLIAIRAARLANQGASLGRILNETRRLMPRTHFFGVVDTLEYLRKGGRIGKAQQLLGTLLNIKPIIECRDGEVCPLEKVRSRRRAIERLTARIQGFGRIEDMALVHSTSDIEVQAVLDMLGSVFPRDKIRLAKFGPVIGTYVGPGALAVALVEGES